MVLISPDIFSNGRSRLEQRIQALQGPMTFRSGSPANIARLATKFPE